MIDIMGCYQCWISGLRIINITVYAVNVLWSTHTQVQNNYFYNGTTIDPYAIRFQTTADNLVQNNIIQNQGWQSFSTCLMQEQWWPTTM